MNVNQKNAIIVIFFAIIIGSLSVFPQFLAIHNMGDRWQGIYPDVNDDEMYYLARGQDVIDGHVFLSNPYLYEHKNGSPMQFWVPDFILAKIVHFFNMSIPAGYKIFDFIFPFLIFILSYLIFQKITKSLPVSLVSTIVLSGGLYLQLFNRTPSPQFIFLFWLLSIYFFLKLINSNENKYLLFTALSLVAMVYMYPYFWTMFVAVIIIYSLTRWISNSSVDLKRVVHIIFLTVLLSIPYFLMQINSMSLSYYDESLTRLGMLNTHFPSGMKIVCIGLLLVLLFLYLFWKKKIKLDKLSLFLFSGSLAPILVVNQHIVTGKNLEFSSHYDLVAIYLFSFAIAYFWVYFLSVIKSNLNKKLFINISLVVVVVILYITAIPVIKSQITAQPNEAHRQRYAPVIEWINKNTKKDDVIYTTNELSKIIPAYTHANVFYAREANLFFVSDEEVEDRFILQNYYKDFDENFIRKHERAIWGTQYINRWGHNQNKVRLASLLGKENLFQVERLPSDEINRIQVKARELKKRKFSDLIKKYRIDYILVDISENGMMDMLNIDGYREIWSNGDFIILKLIV